MCAISEPLAHWRHRWAAQPPLALFLPLPCTLAKHFRFKKQPGIMSGFQIARKLAIVKRIEAPGSALLSGPACCAIALDTCSSTCACRMLCRQVMTSLWPNLGAPPCDVPSCHSNPSLLDSNPSLLAYNTPKQSQNIPNIFMALDLILPYPATPFSNSRYGLARPD